MFIFGLAFFALGMYDLSLSVTNGFAAGNMSPRDITTDRNPIEFFLSITFKFVVGFLSIKYSLSNKK